LEHYSRTDDGALYTFDWRLGDEEEIDPAALNTIVGFVGPVAGFCFGILNLLIGLAFGALGGWLALRNRPQPVPPFEPLS